MTKCGTACRAMRRWLRGWLRYGGMLAAVALALVAWNVGSAFAEAKEGTIGGVWVRSFTDSLSFRGPAGSSCEPKFGHGAPGSSQAGQTLAQIETHTQGANNHDIDWHFVDSNHVFGTNTTFVSAPWTQAGGILPNGALCSQASCYVITQSVYWVNGSPGHEYTSSDGQHSAESCFATAGC